MLRYFIQGFKGQEVFASSLSTGIKGLGEICNYIICIALAMSLEIN